MTFTYENVDLTQHELAQHINNGYAFCAQHKNRHRKSANFTVAGFIAVDIDSGMTIDEALAHGFVNDYAAILYTTPSHTEDFPRFRIVFELATPIVASEDMKNAYKGIIKKFGGDPSCKDACRQFFGSKDSNPRIFGNVLPDDVIAEIIKLGEETNAQHDTAESTAGSGRHAIVSRLSLDQDTLVTDAEGHVRRLQDTPEKTSIYCPVHLDSNPSAFVVKSSKGVVGVHCSSCNTTFFTSSDVPLYDFNYRLTHLTDIGLEEYETIDEDYYLTFKQNGVMRIREAYLPAFDINTDITLVKSPKGTGKTYWLESIVKQCKKDKLSVLLIGHRQSLIQSVAARLQLTPYIYEYSPDAHDKQADRIKTNKPTKYYAICADSLSTLLDTRKDKYDVILIDEVEQVFSHLTANTLKHRRVETFLYFKHYVNCAKKVFVMDADLNRLTVYTLHGFFDDKSKSLRFIINDYREAGRQIDLYEDKPHLMNDLIDAIGKNQRCFVCSNSKKQVQKLACYIEEHFGARKKVLTITSDNSQESAIQDFIRNIKTTILDYDVVIASPSVGTGIDITFPHNAQKIDAVYGFFEARVNTHFDIDQQLSRVRHPKAIKVWISPETFRFDTNPDVIKREVEQTDKSTRQLTGIKPDGALIYNTNDEYLNLYADVKSMQRGSKNNLRHHFKKLKTYEGWAINEITRSDAEAEAGIEIARRGKELFEEESKRRILSAKIITKDEYINLQFKKKTQKLSLYEEDAMRRYEIEAFYYETINEDLINSDNDGKRRQQIRLYEQYKKPDSDLIVSDLLDEKHSVHRTDRKELMVKKQFFHQLLSKAGLADTENDIITDKIIDGDSLLDFSKFCEEQKETIARWFEIDIRTDIHKKPAQQLGRFLQLLGIKWKKVDPVKRDGVKVYRYLIPQSIIDELDAIVKRRQDSDIIQRWHEARNAATENRLFELAPETNPEAEAILHRLTI